MFTNLAHSVGPLYLSSFSLKDQDFQVSKSSSLKKMWPRRTSPLKLRRRRAWDLSLVDPVKRVSLLAGKLTQWRQGVWRKLLRRWPLGKHCCPYPNSKAWRHNKRHNLGWMKFKTCSCNLLSARSKITTAVALIRPHQRGHVCKKLKLSPPKLLSCQPW